MDYFKPLFISGCQLITATLALELVKILITIEILKGIFFNINTCTYSTVGKTGYISCPNKNILEHFDTHMS